jgi:hypothetical protein
VFRGGSWNNNGSNCRASDHGGSAPSYRRINLGFRFAAVPSGE